MAQSETPLLPLGEPSAVFIGRHVRVKGGDILLRAWAQVQEKFPDAVLYMIGDGEEKSNWENAALAEGLNVHFAGQLSNPYPILQSANVMVMPSRREGLPLTFVEGLTLGIPCVAAAVGGIPEAAVDAAILIEPENADEYANAIIKLFDDNNLRARYSGLARERARRFTVQRMAESYGELYLKALRVK
ncbi:MAG: glycosyltransferase family 4 protein [bacterium]|nr:glycosyltransferase family 4 protein [bacterium]